MPTTTIAYRTTVGLLWILVLWHSWESRGLFVDGSAFLVQIARRDLFARACFAQQQNRSIRQCHFLGEVEGFFDYLRRANDTSKPKLLTYFFFESFFFCNVLDLGNEIEWLLPVVANQRNIQ